MTTQYFLTHTFEDGTYILTNHNDHDDTIFVAYTYSYINETYFLCDPMTGEIFDAENVTNYDAYLTAYPPEQVYLI